MEDNRPLMHMGDNTSLFFQIIATQHKVCFDYVPKWGHGQPSNYIDNVIFPKVLTHKKFSYRVVADGTDLGDRKAYEVQSDGSQKVNFLEYNKGYGIESTKKIQVYAVDPSNGNQYLVAHRN